MVSINYYNLSIISLSTDVDEIANLYQHFGRR